VATGIGALAGVGAGVALGVCSFGAWWVGNRYQRLANDPPRTDFDVVTVSAAAFYGGGQSTTDPAAAASLLASQQIVLADALAALVTSIERYDGALAAGDTGAAQSQANAVRQNATAAQSAQQICADLAATLDAWWQQAPLDLSSVTVDAVISNYLAAAGPPTQAPGVALQQALNSVSGLANPQPYADLTPSQDPVLALTGIPASLAALFGPAFLGPMNQLSTILPALVNDADLTS